MSFIFRILIGLACRKTIITKLLTFCRMHRIELRFRTRFRNSRYQRLGTGGGADHRHFALEDNNIGLASV